MRKSLTKREIVRKKVEIDRIFETGKSYSAAGLRVVASPNGLERSRVVVIPVRHYGNSVQRNHVRRQYKELFRAHKESILPGFDLAFVVHRGRALSYKEKEQDLVSLLRRAGLRRA